MSTPTPASSTPPSPADLYALRPGDELLRGLFTRDGAMVLAAGTVLTRDIFATLVEQRGRELFFADSSEDVIRGRFVKMANQVRKPSRKGGSRDAASTLTALEEDQTARLELFEFGDIEGEDPHEVKRERANRVKSADFSVAGRTHKWERLQKRIAPSGFPMPLRPSEGLGWPEPESLELLRAESVHQFRPHFARIAAGIPSDVEPLIEIVADLFFKFERWPDRFAELVTALPNRPDYLPDHCYSTAALSIAIAGRMGWSADDVRLAGLAGLVADVGMAVVPKSLRYSEHALDEYGYNRINRHTAASVVLLDTVSGLPEVVKLAAHQHHEREDGRGYPRSLRGPAICDLARVVAVADTFVAGVANRPYRPKQRPYDALEAVINATARGAFYAPAVRALIKAVGLFPVGSYVRLSSGQRARVVGVDAGHTDRPTVALVGPESIGGGLPTVINLADRASWEIGVTQAVDAPRRLSAHPARAA